MTRHRAMTAPARVPDALYLAVEPQLVHDFAQTFHAGVGKKRAKILWFVPPIRFHAFEDGSSVLAQPIHGGVLTLWTAAESCGLGYFCGPLRFDRNQIRLHFLSYV